MSGRRLPVVWAYAPIPGTLLEPRDRCKVGWWRLRRAFVIRRVQTLPPGAGPTAVRTLPDVFGVRLERYFPGAQEAWK